MPEGDSVWKVARSLEKVIAGREVVRSDFRVPQLATRDLSGRSVVAVDTHGKHLLTRFSGNATLHSHLLMDGEWKTTRPGKRLPPHLQRMVRVVIETTGGSAWGLRMHQLELVPTDQEHRVVGHLGPDPLRSDWDAPEAVRRLRSEPSVPIVSALLDQTKMAGLGNLWANELCFLAGVSPWTPAGDVDLERLVERAATMLHHSATVPGAYQATTGLGRPGQSHWIYGRVTGGCRRCKGPVRRVDEVANDRANRITYWCPHCQPGPGPEARQR
ncbi:Fpg/Nei family DNA glycosylase [Nocardioides acrostichi]|uniref:DNA-(apurinic or apyrimidinic site) lyase n=1 Tax=Nocardioides acrostichi TaxID=2784339 RepID=A0A930Y839_9ACTN|nr:Fpg/Nei family DNA glycosylase [Nocardioides acrostichi]MBF4162651.1 Fpg/Nei family DNA glycosylase [Nocardioides acrostichi]